MREGAAGGVRGGWKAGGGVAEPGEAQVRSDALQQARPRALDKSLPLFGPQFTHLWMEGSGQNHALVSNRETS